MEFLGGVATRAEGGTAVFRVQGEKILVGMKKLRQARIVAEGMAKSFPKAGESRQSIALIHLAEGDKEKSKEALMKSFEMSPASRLWVLEDAFFEEIWRG